MNEYVLRRLFYGYTLGDETGDHIEDCFVGVTASVEEEDELMPIVETSSTFIITDSYNRDCSKLFEERV